MIEKKYILILFQLFKISKSNWSQGTNMLLNELSHTESAVVANRLSISIGSAQWSEGALVGRVQLLHIPLQEHFNVAPKLGTKSFSFTRTE